MSASEQPVLPTAAVWQFSEAVSLLREARGYVPEFTACAEAIDDGLPAIDAALRALAALVAAPAADTFAPLLCTGCGHPMDDHDAMARCPRHPFHGLGAVADHSQRGPAMKRCPGFDENGRAFACDGTPGRPWTPVWCLPCDERRRARISRQMADLLDVIQDGRRPPDAEGSDHAG